MPKMFSRVVRPMTDWQLAWLAGFIDGEGTIGIYHNTGRTCLQLKVNSTCVTVIDFIYKLTGVGTIHFRGDMGNINWHPQKIWVVSGVVEMRDIIRKLLPYLVVKTDQAIMMLEYCDGHISKNPVHDPSYYYKKTKELNHLTKEVKVNV